MGRATNKFVKTAIVFTILTIIIYPFFAHAGVFNVLSWVNNAIYSSGSESRVLSANTVATKEELLAYPEPTINTVNLLHAINNPQQTSAKMASNLAMVSGVAFTNENNSLDGSFEEEKNTGDQISLYTVRDGDTVPQIAKMFSVSSNTIYWANDLKVGSPLKPDQIIVILPIDGIKYTVKKGDTAESLAKKFKSDASEIISFNNIDVSVGLTVGEEIIVPDANLNSPAKPQICKGSSCSTASNVAFFRKPVGTARRTQGLHGHNGIDFASYLGAPIYAAAGGTVILSKSGAWNGGYGNYVVIKHSNGMQTLYGHMSENLVRAGDVVAKGQQIGKMGSTGQSTGTHLHFEVRGGKNPF